MDIDKKEHMPQSKSTRIDPVDESKALEVKEIEAEVSKEVGEVEKQEVFQGRPPTRFTPYPLLEFTVHHRSKHITPTGHVLV